MNLIALETSSHRISAALWCNGAVSERAENLPNGGSERLLPWVTELLADAGIGMRDLNGVAFGTGPGGFTGLRLACGVAQGLAMGLDLPVVGVSTLEALVFAAHAACGKENFFACIDARMNEVYYVPCTVCDGLPEMLSAPAVAAPQLVLPPPGTGWVGIGDGFAAYPDVLRRVLADAVVEFHADIWPTAASVACIAVQRLARGEGVDAALALPLYVRDKVALTTAERLARGGVK